MRKLVCLVVLAAMVGGCGSKKSESGEAGETDPAASSAETKPGDKSGARPGDKAGSKPGKKPGAPTDIAEADAGKILEAWLAAQNGGDLAAYEKLYAKQFFGIKRVGEKKTMYDRGGWLEDRGRMFKNKMVVEASGVTISANPRSAVIHFSQTWSSGKFRDQGPKQLIVVIEDGALKISREEMLQSQPAPALVAWVAKSSKGEPIEGKSLPADVKAELVLLSDGLQGDETLGEISWAMAISPDLVAFEIDSSQEFGDDGPPGWHRGDTAHLVVAKSNQGRFVVSGAASEQGVGFKLASSAAIDSDAIGDPTFSWSWYHDHEGAEGIAVVLTKTASVSVIQTGESGGEAGWSSGRTIAGQCFTKVDGAPAYVMSYMDESTEPEDEDNWMDSESVEREAPGFALHVADASGVFNAMPAYVYWTSHGKDAGDGLDQAPCKDGNGAFWIPGLATSTLAEQPYAVAGLSSTEDAAKNKAAAAKQPLDRILLLGEWEEHMKVKENQPNAGFQMPEKK